MIPAIIAQHIRQQIRHYLESTFEFRDRATGMAFQQFLTDPATGIFKGPWIHLQRPFRPAEPGCHPPFRYPLGFTPFRHQIQAWERLSTADQSPRSTIITTGTGSGKTECFLLPILDHCLRTMGTPGIKAIILYPMNALADDQERRFAEFIDRTAVLRDAGIRVGCYIGRYDPSDPAASMQGGDRTMGPDHGISHHETLRTHPPDILLTNYKMLDFLLIRPEDQPLWQHNHPDTLQYLVLDELHTYDGAQGSDVACLIRRLKERLHIPDGSLCAVGTSATLDDRSRLKTMPDHVQDDATEPPQERLARFAGKLFGESFDPDAVIGEDRLRVAEFVTNDREILFPDPAACRPEPDETADAYVKRQFGVWRGEERKEGRRNEERGREKSDRDLTKTSPTHDPRNPPIPPLSIPSNPPIPPRSASGNPQIPPLSIHGNPPIPPLSIHGEGYGGEVSSMAGGEVSSEVSWRIDLGNWVRSSTFFTCILTVFESAENAGTDPLTWQDLIDGLSRTDRVFGAIPHPDDRELILGSFLGLVNASRIERSGKTTALAPVQVQLWIRELRRVGRLAAPNPVFCWMDEPGDRLGLPAVHCGECGESGWLALHKRDDDTQLAGGQGIHGFRIQTHPTSIYREFIGRTGNRGRNLIVMVPRRPGEICPRDTQGDIDRLEWYFYPDTRIVRQGEDPDDTAGIPIHVSNDTRQLDSGEVVGVQVCPYCGSPDGLYIVGSQAATLSSVAIDELFGSYLNNDARLLAFTDSVQDASHRAAFFSARTYHFTLRTAIRRMVGDAGAAGIRLSDSGRQLLEWVASQPEAGSMAAAISTLLPPDLKEFPEYLAFRTHASPAARPPESLTDRLAERLTWEVISEFGLMETHGRTLERSGSACLAYDPRILGQTISEIRQRLEPISRPLLDIPERNWWIWLLGMLHRHRLRGALYHPFLDDLAAKHFWGKLPFGRVVDGRETYPPAGRYRPHLIVTQTADHHDAILAMTRSRPMPWPIVWTRRALDLPDRIVTEPELIDLIQTLLRCGTESGLLRQIHAHGSLCYYGIDPQSASIVADSVHFECSESGRSLVRPTSEAGWWEHAPSLEYAATRGHYRQTAFTPRQEYYRSRYRRGKIRRVISMEHTGMLTSDERNRLEKEFKSRTWPDDPNVIACTSTLEMGIDIGELSSAMLCSIPPQTVNYLQRIGRAGRHSGAALIIAIVNQKPHDLFFHARPREMLKGRIDPPGCWLDASAVLIRQYLAFCFDCASAQGILMELPRTARQMREDFQKRDGRIPVFLDWIADHEPELRDRFLHRFTSEISAETTERVRQGTDTARIRNRIQTSLDTFYRMVQELENARKRLREQLRTLEKTEESARDEIDAEEKTLSSRIQRLNRVTSLELLTDHGLLPNYAFPERGVRFYGSMSHRGTDRSESRKAIEVVRPAGAAIHELAPGNTFYTHSRRFHIQQLTIGSSQDSLLERFAICGHCGYMQSCDTHPTTQPECPQCGYSGDGSPADPAQHRAFLFFPDSTAISIMDPYDSLSGDRSDERDQAFYHLRRQFDLTGGDVASAVGNDAWSFGIEYRPSLTLRDVNAGFHDAPALLPFGPDGPVPQSGFRLCRDCGMAMGPGGDPEKSIHRRNCSARRKSDRLKQENRPSNVYQWEEVFLYREIQSEAIRMLLPDAGTDDIETLKACFHLGLHLRFEGQPDHLSVMNQTFPDIRAGIDRHSIVLMDLVPGGTGFLKTLYQKKDAAGNDGEGVVDVMRLALDALETCVCGRMRLNPNEPETDGCYRCIRSYHLQYHSGRISRQRGIGLLKRLIAAAEHRHAVRSIDDVSPIRIMVSDLEQRFVASLRQFVMQRGGSWMETLVGGKPGYRFTLRGMSDGWLLECQPVIGPPQGVTVSSQPDFLLRNDTEEQLPIAIFTDGYEYHVDPFNRLADDMIKRQAILRSGRFRIWAITWDDLSETADPVNLFEPQIMVVLKKLAELRRAGPHPLPDPVSMTGHGFAQLCEYLTHPDDAGWTYLAEVAAYWTLPQQITRITLDDQTLQNRLDRWMSGEPVDLSNGSSDGSWTLKLLSGNHPDFLAVAGVADLLARGMTDLEYVQVFGRWDDRDETIREPGYRERWRRSLCLMNVAQFGRRFQMGSVHESAARGFHPEHSQRIGSIPDAWKPVWEVVVGDVRTTVARLAGLGLPVPETEFSDATIDPDAFAELAWPDVTAVVLAGGQLDAAPVWRQAGWQVLSPADLDAMPDEAIQRLFSQTGG